MATQNNTPATAESIMDAIRKVHPNATPVAQNPKMVTYGAISVVQTDGPLVLIVNPGECDDTLRTTSGHFRRFTCGTLTAGDVSFTVNAYTVDAEVTSRNKAARQADRDALKALQKQGLSIADLIKAASAK